MSSGLPAVFYVAVILNLLIVLGAFRTGSFSNGNKEGRREEQTVDDLTPFCEKYLKVKQTPDHQPNNVQDC